MIRIIVLGSIYMLMLFALAAGVQSLTGSSCSDWLANCPANAPSLPRAPTIDDRQDVPDDAQRQ